MELKTKTKRKRKRTKRKLLREKSTRSCCSIQLHYVTNRAFRVWQQAAKQADTAEILGFVESNYKDKMFAMAKKFEDQVNIEKKIRQEEHATYTLKSCVKRIVWMYQEKLKSGFYPWKKMYHSEKQQYAAALMLFKCMQNNISRTKQQKFTLWLKLTLVKRGIAQRKEILKNFRKVESYWEHRVQLITERRDLNYRNKIQEITKLQDQIAQRFNQHKERIKISNTKLIIKMNL